MLAVVETYLRSFGAAKSNGDIRRVLTDVVQSFGFRSGYVIEYAGKLSRLQHCIDTDADRQNWWVEYFASDVRPTLADVAAALRDGSLVHLDATRFGPG